MHSSNVHEDLASRAADEIASTLRTVTGVDKAGLHEPIVGQAEIDAVAECILSGFVSSVGPAITQFENLLCDYTGARHAIAVINGTAALHLMLLATGVRQDDEVLVPALTFVASGNAIIQAGAKPHFVDSSTSDLGIDASSLDSYLFEIGEMRDDRFWNRKTGRFISHVMPVHVFGHIGDMVGLKELAGRYNLQILEDAAEALGSKKHGRHAGLFGKCGALSFNGNKIVTTGGGGAILTDDEFVAKRIRSLATTAKLRHPFLYWHDELGFNYRMPALNAAFGTAQLERLDAMLDAKLRLRAAYEKAFASKNYASFFSGPNDCVANNWLNAIHLDPSVCKERDAILHKLNKAGFGCRPVWSLLSELPHFSDCPTMPLKGAMRQAELLINIPSGAAMADCQ